MVTVRHIATIVVWASIAAHLCVCPTSRFLWPQWLVSIDPFAGPRRSVLSVLSVAERKRNLPTVGLRIEERVVVVGIYSSFCDL